MELSIYLPPKAKSLVEFGCGSGEMGRSFKRIAPFCRYIGVEKNAALAQAARAHLDEVVTANVADVSFEEGDEVDCLVYHSGFLSSSESQRMLREHATYVSCGGGSCILRGEPCILSTCAFALARHGSSSCLLDGGKSRGTT